MTHQTRESLASDIWHAEALLQFVHGRLIPTLQSLSGSPVRETISGVFSERNVIVAASGYDPAAGTCGFLVEAYAAMQEHAEVVSDGEKLQQGTFYGNEKKAVPALLGTLNMVLHGVTAPDLRRKNTSRTRCWARSPHASTWW